MRYIYGWLALILMMTAPLAQAQVFKCAAAGGRTVYSDSPCSGGASGGMIERERSYQEKLQERQMAYEAEMTKQDRRMAQQQREWAEQDRAMQYQAAPATRPPANDWQSRKDRENARSAASSITKNGGRWDEAAEAQRREDARARARAAPPPRPTSITNCHGGFCTDNEGGSYHRWSKDNMTGPNGQSCYRAGNMWNCN